MRDRAQRRRSQLERILSEGSGGVCFSPPPSAQQVDRLLFFIPKDGPEAIPVMTSVFPLGGARPASLGLMGRFLAGSGEWSLHFW